MVSGTYGAGLVGALNSFSIASGRDPYLVSPTPVAQIEKMAGDEHLQVLPLSYSGDVNLAIVL